MIACRYKVSRGGRYQLIVQAKQHDLPTFPRTVEVQPAVHASNGYSHLPDAVAGRSYAFTAPISTLVLRVGSGAPRSNEPSLRKPMRKPKPAWTENDSIGRCRPQRPHTLSSVSIGIGKKDDLKPYGSAKAKAKSEAWKPASTNALDRPSSSGYIASVLNAQAGLPAAECSTYHRRVLDVLAVDRIGKSHATSSNEYTAENCRAVDILASALEVVRR